MNSGTVWTIAQTAGFPGSHRWAASDYIAVPRRGAFQGIEATGRRVTISEFTSALEC
jgi:hypothetical protein